MYIIIWRHNHKEPFVGVDSRGFLETFYSHEEAETEAKETYERENSDGERSPWYFNYKIYELSE